MIRELTEKWLATVIVKEWFLITWCFGALQAQLVSNICKDKPMLGQGTEKRHKYFAEMQELY